MKQWVVVAVIVLGLGGAVRASASAPTYPSHVDDLYSQSAPKDTDQDGLTDQGEVRIFGTDPTKADTDGDGYSDGAEVMLHSDPLNPQDPAGGLVSRPVASPFPWAWIVTRASGIASYLLLFLLSITGMTITTGLLYRLMSPGAAWSFHRTVGLTLFVSVVVHLVSLLLDTFIKMRIVDVLIPFVSTYQPLLVALGIVGFYLMVLLIYTSIWQIGKHAGFWRFVHFFGFPMFILLFLHGILLGTDRHQWWAQLMYWGTAGIVGSLTVYRLAWKARASIQPRP